MKATNRISISVRITQEDADFIAERKMEGANTPSEKSMNCSSRCAWRIPDKV
ncbi:hypothetical protein ACTHTU_10710 [Neisseria sp. P0020.S005]|uniref:hypothetical protein n=1 Tax=Neisseria sp. P0020.S005 TaxID=3436810 RepID=UPI003F814983